MAVNERWSFLLDGYLAGTLANEEHAEMVELLETESGKQYFRERAEAELQEGRFAVDEPDHGVYQRIFNNILRRIRAENETEQVKLIPVIALKPKRSIYWIAASVTILIAFSLFFILRPGTDRDALNDALASDSSIRPGINKAILKLSDGSVISLDSASRGMLAREHGANVEKKDSGVLLYKGQGSEATSDQIVYNILETPRGGEYSIVLEDGTRVWLNSASSLKFPTRFTGDSRTVEMTGEAYFEVAKDPAKPFRVIAGEVTNEVLGTAFNVNGYNDEPYTKVTLVEGRIRVSNAAFSAVMQPGQQAAVKNDIHTIKSINIQSDIAWKNGFFEFRNATIESVMRQLSRWYDLDVIYESKPNKLFLATIPRDASIEQVLRVLEYTDAVHFKVNGKAVTVKR